ncbi:MAG: hypothetical protein J0I60_13610 [Nitrosospira sp.]|nr:hypothetical protein [Nitrosospira sp.]
MITNIIRICFRLSFRSALSIAGKWIMVGSLTHGCIISVHADEFKITGNQQTQAVVIRPGYDYAPTLMSESGSVKMWWCASLPGVEGDQILYLNNLASGDQAFYEPLDGRIKRVFSSSGDKNKFDAAHVCDPSVIHVDGRYYMYYGGIDVLKKRMLKLPNPTAIGVAVSDDGVHWMRANDGAAILTVADTAEGKVNTYGVGQPSVVYVSPYYYMIFTDTTAPVSTPKDGWKLFIVRSENPLFSSFEELTQEGFRPIVDGKVMRNFRILEGFSAEMVFIDTWNLFMVAVNRKPKETWLYFFDKNFQPVGNRVSINDEWSEGPGIIKDRLGHLQPSANDRVNLEMVRSVGDRMNPGTWDLYLETVELERLSGEVSKH